MAVTRTRGSDTQLDSTFEELVKETYLGAVVGGGPPARRLSPRQRRGVEALRGSEAQPGRGVEALRGSEAQPGRGRPHRA